MEYNTERRELLLKEYGRSVQEMIAYICSLEDKEQRTAYAYLLVNLMKQLNPAVRDSMDTPQRVWDHLHHMSGYKLDIDGPFPAPDPGKLFAKPDRMSPPHREAKIKSIGRNMESMVVKAAEIEDEEAREAALVHVGRTLKSFYYAWYREVLEDEAIVEYLRVMSQGKADLRKLWEEYGPMLFDSRSVPNKERQQQMLMKVNDRHNGNQANMPERKKNGPPQRNRPPGKNSHDSMGGHRKNRTNKKR